MIIRNVLFVVGLSAAVGVGPALAQDAHTTRIESRHVYGAIVSIESGVRVFRPLPPTRHVIINPEGATPLSLNVSEKRVYQRSYNESRHYHRHDHDHGELGGIITHTNTNTGRY